MAARLCLDCLLANVKRQDGYLVPVASTSRAAFQYTARSYSTLPSASDSLRSASPEAEKPAEGASVQPDASLGEGSTNRGGTAGTSPSRPTLESTRTLALARWSSLRQSALQALERQQRELRHKLADASAKINDVSGYKEIEALKAEVTRKELELLEARTAAREAKEAHAAALAERMSSGREVNDLLQRKNNWLDSDVLRFTELVRQDHLNEQKERDSKIEVTREEEGVERKIGEMMQAILKRYHEEQVWSDKIRSLSTYGSLAITSLNVIVFVLALILVEPWKRRRMVAEVEGRIKERDELQTERLDQSLQDIKGLIQEGLLPLQVQQLDNVDNRTLISNSIAERQEDLLLPEAEFSNQVDSTASYGETLPSEPEASQSLVDKQIAPTAPTTKERDIWYAGVGGTLLGAALVTTWNALFR